MAATPLGISGNYDFPNPLPLKRTASLLTHTCLALALVGSMFPSRATGFPVPEGPRRVVVSWSDSFKLPLTTVRPPSIQQDWPVPKGPKGSISLLTWTDSFKLPLTTVRPPSIQRDWPNPRGYKPLVIDWSDSFKLPLTTVQGVNQYDWPVPRGAAPLNRGFADSFKLPLTTVVGFNQYDWPNPPGYAPLVRTWTASFALPLTTVRGFNQYDWQNPRGAKPVGLSWSDSFKLPLTTVRAPYTQFDWPNPGGYRRNEALGQPQASGPALLSSIATAPFSLTYWPNPRGAAGGVLSFSDGSKLPLTTVLTGFPSRATGFPVPVSATPSIGLMTWLGWVDSFALPLSSAVEPPPPPTVTVYPGGAYPPGPDYRGPRGQKPKLGTFKQGQGHGLKKKKKRDEIEELILELKERIIELPDLQEWVSDDAVRLAYQRAYAIDAASSMREMTTAIRTLREAIQEIDDEEVLLLIED